MSGIGPLWGMKERVVDHTAAEVSVELLYRRDGARLERALIGAFGNRELAQDAAAEAFVQLLRRGDGVEFPARWVWKAAFAIARGVAAEGSGRSDRPVPDTSVVAGERDLDVLEALRTLSPMQRQAVVLHHYAGFDLRAVAEITGSTVGALKVHLLRARQRMRTQLGDTHER